MTWYELLINNANAVACLLIAVRLLFFSRGGKRHRLAMAGLAYVIILASAYIAFRIWFGQYKLVDPAELLLNIFICIAVFRARGNIAETIIRS